MEDIGLEAREERREQVAGRRDSTQGKESDYRRPRKKCQIRRDRATTSHGHSRDPSPPPHLASPCRSVLFYSIIFLFSFHISWPTTMTTVTACSHYASNFTIMRYCGRVVMASRLGSNQSVMGNLASSNLVSASFFAFFP